MGKAFGYGHSAGFVLSAIIAAQAAWAADQPPPVSDANEIVVTAQKRAERLLDVPQSVSAISADDLRKLNATHFSDFANTVPALSFTTSGVGQSQITLRGVTAGVDIGPTVGIYVDDVPYGSSSAFTNAASLGLDAGLFDLDRVEVLRGPQGTLYGASAMGGVLRYITRKPDLAKVDADLQTGLSFTHDGGTNYNEAAAISVPLVTDKLAIKASGFINHDGGYIDDVALGDKNVGRSRVYGGRLDLLFHPTEKLSIQLSGLGQNIHRDGVLAADYTLAGAPVDGDLDQRRAKAEPFDQRFRLVSGNVNYDFGPATLTSISSYQTIRTHYRLDSSEVYVPLLASLGLPLSAAPIDQTRNTNKFTQEVRLASASGGFVEWLVGGFYTRETSDNLQHIAAYDLAGEISAIDLATAAIASRYEEVAGFANVTLHLTHAFDITGGVRYAHNDQWFEQNASGLLAASVPAARSSDGVATYLANARYRFSRHAMIYVRYATGYRPGGPNFVARDPVTGAALAPASFKSDLLRSYEAGFKAETADGTFGIDAAGYHIDWNNIQAPTSAGGVSVITNAGKAKIDGGELTLRATPDRDVNITGAFAYQNARLAEDAPLLGATRGERLPNVPKFTASINADYTAIGRKLKPTIGATLRFVSDRFASFDGNTGLPQYHLPSYAALDLRAGLTIGPVYAQLFARNVTDLRGQLSASTSLAILGGPAQVTILQPRTIGLSASTHF